MEIGQESSGSVETQAGDLSLPRKQLVVSEGAFAWETDPIILSEPILTSVSIDFTAVAGPLGFSGNDRVKIYAVLRFGQVSAPAPLLEVNLVDDVLPNTTVEMTGALSIGALAEARWDNSLPNGSGFGGITGVVTRLRQLRLVLDLASENPGNYLALDHLVATEASATITDPAAWERQARRLIPFNVSSHAVLDPNTPSMEIGASYDRSGL